MTLQELKIILEQTGFPVAYSHFNEPQTPPFIAYIVDDSSNVFADDNVLHEIENVQIELYTTKKDLTIEKKVKDVLKQNNLPYETSETFIQSENLYQKIYEVSL